MPKKDQPSPAELRRLEKKANALLSDTLYKELKKQPNLQVRQKPNKDLEIKIEL